MPAGRRAAALLAAFLVTLATLIAPDGAVGQTFDGPLRTLVADPATVFDAELPRLVRLEAGGFSPETSVLFTLAGASATASTDSNGVATASLPVQQGINCDGESERDLPATATQNGVTTTTDVRLICPTYDLDLEFDPAPGSLPSDVGYRAEPAQPIYSAPSADPSTRITITPEVRLCIRVADPGGATRADATPVTAGTPVPPSAGAARIGRVAATETVSLSSRETTAVVSRSDRRSLSTEASVPGCYQVLHGGATSDQRGTVAFTGKLDFNANEEALPQPSPEPSATPTVGLGETPDPRNVTVGPVNLNLFESRRIAITPFCGNGTTRLTVTGAVWEEGDRVVITSGGTPITDAPFDAIVGANGTFSVTIPDYVPATGRQVISAEVRRYVEEVSLAVPTQGVLVDVNAEQVPFLNPCEPPTLLVQPGRIALTGADPVVGFSLSGFKPDRPFTLTGTPFELGPVLDESGQPTVSVADGAGRFRGKVAIRRPSCGQQRFTASSAEVQAVGTVLLTCPALTVNPDRIAEFDQPTTTAVTGTGFNPDSVVAVALAGTLTTVRTDAEGAFTVRRTVSDLPCNGGAPYEVSAQEQDAANGPRAVAPLTITCPGDPAVSVVPGKVAYTPGTRPLVVTVTNFRPSLDVRLTLDGAPIGTAADTPGPIRVVTVTVSDVPCGSHVLRAQDNRGNRAETALLVTCPTITVSPDALGVDELPRSVAVVGTGFDLSTPVELTLPGAPVRVVTSDPDGGFRITFVPRDVPCDDLTMVTAVEQVTLPVPPQAQAPFLVRCPAPPTLSVDPPVVAASSGFRVVQVRGTGWRPGSSVPLDVGDGTAPTTVTADDAGAFVESLTLTSLTPGQREISATQPYRSATTTLQVTDPRLTVTPDTVSRDALPDTVVVQGTGFDPGVGVRVDLPALGPVAATTDDTGRFTVEIDPVDAACGAAIVRAVEDFGPSGPAVPPPSAEDDFTVRCPSGPTLTMTPNPAAFTPGPRTFTVTGQSFRPGPVPLVLDGEPVGVGTADPLGRLSVPLTLSAVPCGRHLLEGAPRPGFAAATVLDITCPSLRVDPAQLDERTRPSTVTVIGTGFDPRTPVEVTQQDGTVTRTTTDAQGGLRTSVPASTLPCDRSVVVAVEDVELQVPPTATAEVTVACIRFDPTLVVRPLVVAEGSTARVQGSGFPANSTVRLSWELLPGRGPGLGSALARTDDSGAFSTTVLVFRNDQLGQRTAVAIEQSGVTATSNAVLAVAGTVQPGRQETVILTRRGLLGRR